MHISLSMDTDSIGVRACAGGGSGLGEINMRKRRHILNKKEFFKKKRNVLFSQDYTAN